MTVDYFTRVQGSPGWARILDSFLRFATPVAGSRALDVGCGPGALTRRWAALGCVAHGVDVDPSMMARAEELARAENLAVAFQVGSVTALPFPDAHFDLVTATNVIFLIPDPLAGLREMARVCATGGGVAMLNPSPKLSRAVAQAHAETVGLKDFDAFSLVNWGTLAENHRRFSESEIRDLFLQAGLRSTQVVEKIGPGLALFAKGSRP